MLKERSRISLYWVDETGTPAFRNTRNQDGTTCQVLNPEATALFGAGVPQQEASAGTVPSQSQGAAPSMDSTHC